MFGILEGVFLLLFKIIKNVEIEELKIFKT